CREIRQEGRQGRNHRHRAAPQLCAAPHRPQRRHQALLGERPRRLRAPGAGHGHDRSAAGRPIDSRIRGRRSQECNLMGAVQKIEAAEAHVPTVITPGEMIQQAIQQGSGVEVMERLLALQERYDAFNARKAFDDAMADLRSNLPKITKSREVDFTTSKGRPNYRFEDLAEITEALAEPMSAVGLSFRWHTDNVQGGVKVTCRITHRDGHFEETSLVGPLDATGNKNAIQAIGSAVTYLQRYTLKAAVGIAAAHDDDAQQINRRDE